MVRVGSVVKLALDEMKAQVKAGVNTQKLDDTCAGVLDSHGARSAPQLVYGFPGAACISINEEAIHGIPRTTKTIRAGDLVKLDVTAELDGFVADSAVTVAVANASPTSLRLAKCAQSALQIAIQSARAGRPINRIGRAVQAEVERQGFNVMPQLGGHGVGRTIHESPSVHNYYIPWDERNADPRRVELAADRYRPAYHYLCPANWMNDPNGTTYWKGRYHIFYQYNPNGAFHGTIHWGHASSEDLVRWMDHPIALTPGPDGPDRDHCYNGAAFVNKEGVPTFIYHGLPDGICLDTSDDDMLIHWDKHPAEPDHPQSGARRRVRGRRGSVCLGGWDSYYAITGNSIHFPDRAFLFTANDLSSWRYRHVFYEGGFFTDGGSEDCAVPDFFPLGDRHVLLFASHRRGTQCYIGTLANERFTPERHERLAYGDWGRPGIYCEGLTLLDDDDRRILFGRLHEARYSYVQRASGWAGMFAIPIVMSLSPSSELMLHPVPEIKKLRGSHPRLSDISLPAESNVRLDEIRGDRLEIEVTFDWQGSEEVGLKMLASPGGEEETVVRFNTNPSHSYRRPNHRSPNGRQLTLDVTRSSVSQEVMNRESEWRRLEVPDGQSVTLRVFIDRSVVEVFAGSRHYLAKRVYPERTDSIGVWLYARGGTTTVRTLDAWEMDPIWPISQRRPRQKDPRRSREPLGRFNARHCLSPQNYSKSRLKIWA